MYGLYNFKGGRYLYISYRKAYKPRREHTSVELFVFLTRLVCYTYNTTYNTIFLTINQRYYIHGRSVHGRSDTSLHELYEQFQREEENLCGKRGLEPNSDRQTFEMALSVRFCNEYSKILQPLLTRDVQGARRGQQNMTRQNPSMCNFS